MLFLILYSVGPDQLTFVEPGLSGSFLFMDYRYIQLVLQNNLNSTLCMLGNFECYFVFRCAFSK